MLKPPQLTPLDKKEQQLYSKLFLDDGAPHPIFKAVPGHPRKRPISFFLYPGYGYFVHDPNLMSTNEGWNVD